MLFKYKNSSAADEAFYRLDKFPIFGREIVVEYARGDRKSKAINLTINLFNIKNIETFFNIKGSNEMKRKERAKQRRYHRDHREDREHKSHSKHRESRSRSRSHRKRENKSHRKRYSRSRSHNTRSRSRSVKEKRTRERPKSPPKENYPKSPTIQEPRYLSNKQRGIMKIHLISLFCFSLRNRTPSRSESKMSQ